MKSKRFSYDSWDVVMETPKHSQVVDAELRAMDNTGMGVPYLNQAKFQSNCVAMALKSVKNNTGQVHTELITTFDAAIQFVDGCGEDLYRLMTWNYGQIVSVDKEIEKIKNSEAGVTPPPSKTP